MQTENLGRAGYGRCRGSIWISWNITVVVQSRRVSFSNFIEKWYFGRENERHGCALFVCPGRAVIINLVSQLESYKEQIHHQAVPNSKSIAGSILIDVNFCSRESVFSTDIEKIVNDLRKFWISVNTLVTIS